MAAWRLKTPAHNAKFPSLSLSRAGREAGCVEGCSERHSERAPLQKCRGKAISLHVHEFLRINSQKWVHFVASIVCAFPDRSDVPFSFSRRKNCIFFFQSGLIMLVQDWIKKDERQITTTSGWITAFRKGELWQYLHWLAGPKQEVETGLHVFSVTVRELFTKLPDRHKKK